MQDVLGYIERVRRVSPTHVHLEVAVATSEEPFVIKPGVVLLARLVSEDAEVEHWDPYLREQWWLQGYTSERLLLVERPASARYRPGQYVRLLGPVGKFYRFRQSLRTVLLLAYDTDPTPLTIMTHQLADNEISITLVLLGRARTYQTTHLPPAVEVIHGEESLAWPDQLMTLGWADQIFVAVQPDDDLGRFAEVKRLVEELRTDIPKNYLFGVFQPIMPCGMGACSACVVRIGKTLVPVCQHGPAFDLKTVKLPK